MDLETRAKELMIGAVPRNVDLMQEVFMFDPLNLEATSSLKISQYMIGVSQFLLYYQSQVNYTRIGLMKKKRFLEHAVSVSGVKGGTKAERKQKVLDQNEELYEVDKEAECLEQELILMDKMDIHLAELINTFKRELTRREKEQTVTRDERRY